VSKLTWYPPSKGQYLLAMRDQSLQPYFGDLMRPRYPRLHDPSIRKLYTGNTKMEQNIKVVQILAISQDLRQNIKDSKGKCYGCSVNLKVNNDLIETEKMLISRRRLGEDHLVDSIVSR